MKKLALAALLALSTVANAAGSLYEARVGKVHDDGITEVVVQLWTDTIRGVNVQFGNLEFKNQKKAVARLRELIMGKTVFLNPGDQYPDGTYKCLIYIVNPDGTLRDLGQVLVDEKLAKRRV